MSFSGDVNDIPAPTLGINLAGWDWLGLFGLAGASTGAFLFRDKFK